MTARERAERILKSIQTKIYAVRGMSARIATDAESVNMTVVETFAEELQELEDRIVALEGRPSSW